ncbi:unnamed protein product [Withania somnifera]
MADSARSSNVRLKREDCKRTKHDSAFSDWKILVGSNDWEDYLLGKEGTERYRTHNLPNCTSCPGVYELGIAVSRRQAGREATRLDPDYIVPVYVGKSDNVRTRLQRYGREGAHLENGFFNNELNVHENVYGPKRARLFTETFSRGFSIVYRWAPMNDNKDAERTEAQLLDKFDYAWNKGSNGVRRHNDVLCKLDDISRATRLPAFIRKLQLSLEKQKGIIIKVCEPLSLENGSDFHVSFKNTNFLPQIFKFGRSQPRIVSMSSGVNVDPNTIICGVALGHGSVCIRPPIKGNKRCSEHKGMKINSVNSKLIAERNESTGRCETGGEANASICGFILDNGSPCARKPFQRNKRCAEHKGMKVNSVNSKLIAKENESTRPCEARGEAICGFILDNGSPCARKPFQRNKRCLEHKGRRIRSFISQPMT